MISLFYNRIEYQGKAVLRLYSKEVSRICLETKPERAGFARKLWERDRGALAALRLYRQLGVCPRGRYTWITHLLQNDLAKACSGHDYFTDREAFNLAVHYISEYLKAGFEWGSESRVTAWARSRGRVGRRLRLCLASPKPELETLRRLYSIKG